MLLQQSRCRSLVDFSTSTEEKSKIFISHRKILPKLKTDRAKFLTCFLATNTRSIAVEVEGFLDEVRLVSHWAHCSKAKLFSSIVLKVSGSN